MRSHDLWTRWFSEARAKYETGIAEMSAKLAAKYPEKYTIETAEEGFRRLAGNRVVDVSAEAVQRFDAADDEDLAWLIDALRDQQGRWFVAALAYTSRAGKLPDVLFAPMLLAAIEDGGDLSFIGSYFVQPWRKVGRLAEAGHFLIDQFELQPGPRRISVLRCLAGVTWGTPNEDGRRFLERKVTVLIEAFSTEADTVIRRALLRWLYGLPPELPDSLHSQLRQIAESVQHDPDPEIREQYAEFTRQVEALSIKRSE